MSGTVTVTLTASECYAIASGCHAAWNDAFNDGRWATAAEYDRAASLWGDRAREARDGE